MFEFETEELITGRSSRYRWTKEGQPLPYSRVLQLWQHSDAFVEVFVRSLQESPFEAFRWETPPISLESRSCNFEFVLINAPEFVQRKIDSVSFADHFNSAGSGAEAIAFRNLRGDARLVVPAPLVHVDAYGHLASFLRKAAKDQIRELWRCVGREMEDRLHDVCPCPVWLSTAGGGVAWLHVRLDSSPKYYSHAAYRSW